MKHLKSFCGILALTILATTAVIQTQGKAYEQKSGEWRIHFNGIQQSEGVKVSIKADDGLINIQGTPANLGIIFKAKSGAFQPKQKTATQGKSHLWMFQEPVIITVRSKGNELMKINAAKAEIAYEKNPVKAQ